jgi:hypothetical protein
MSNIQVGGSLYRAAIPTPYATFNGVPLQFEEGGDEVEAWALYSKTMGGIEITPGNTVSFLMDNIISDPDGLASADTVEGDSYVFLTNASWYEVQAQVSFYTAYLINPGSDGSVDSLISSNGFLGHNDTRTMVFQAGDYTQQGFTMRLSYIDFFYPPSEGFTNSFSIEMTNNLDVSIYASVGQVLIKKFSGGVDPR